MALNWSFKEKAGTVTQRYGDKMVTQNFYVGNALMIVPYEYEENGEAYYNMSWFFCDKDHAKNCLGLTKGRDGMFDSDEITHLTIYREYCRPWKDIVDLFTKAFPKITIELLEKEV